MAELKPCPFCGRTPIVDDCGDHRYFVRCKCGIVQDKLYAQKCDAVRRWNTRKTGEIAKDTNVPSNDCISRHAAIDMFQNLANDDWNKDTSTTWANAFAESADMIEDLPSAQPEIVRCKECKHSEHWYKDKRRCFLWHETGIDVFEDGYCNYADRREGQDDA